MSSSKRSISVRKLVISDDAVLTALQASVRHARSHGIEVAVAIADITGNVVGYIRMPSAFIMSGDLAKKKAASAAGLGLETEQAESILAQEDPRVREGVLLQPNFTLIRGGLPIRVDGELIGAIGVSGGSEAQDVECAKAGLNAILEI